jgi:hypothetical protein
VSSSASTALLSLSDPLWAELLAAAALHPGKLKSRHSAKVSAIHF